MELRSRPSKAKASDSDWPCGIGACTALAARLASLSIVQALRHTLVSGVVACAAAAAAAGAASEPTCAVAWFVWMLRDVYGSDWWVEARRLRVPRSKPSGARASESGWLPWGRCWLAQSSIACALRQRLVTGVITAAVPACADAGVAAPTSAADSSAAPMACVISALRDLCSNVVLTDTCCCCLLCAVCALCVEKLRVAVSCLVCPVPVLLADGLGAVDVRWGKLSSRRRSLPEVGGVDALLRSESLRSACRTARVTRDGAALLV